MPRDSGFVGCAPRKYSCTDLRTGGSVNERKVFSTRASRRDQTAPMAQRAGDKRSTVSCFPSPPQSTSRQRSSFYSGTRFSAYKRVYVKDPCVHPPPFADTPSNRKQLITSSIRQLKCHQSLRPRRTPRHPPWHTLAMVMAWPLRLPLLVRPSHPKRLLAVCSRTTVSTQRRWSTQL